jgi:hypothetical protein
MLCALWCHIPAHSGGSGQDNVSQSVRVLQDVNIKSFSIDNVLCFHFLALVPCYGYHSLVLQGIPFGPLCGRIPRIPNTKVRGSKVLTVVYFYRTAIQLIVTLHPI